MPKIRFIVDAEAFIVKGKTLIKELGVLDRDTNTFRSYYFKVGCIDDLSDFDRINALYGTKAIHGLEFNDDEDDLPQEEVMEIFKNLGIAAGGDLIAYKGGNIELKLLKDAGFARLAFNLESLHCPKFNELVELMPQAYKEARHNQCDRHIEMSKAIHCPLVEIKMFDIYCRKINN